MDYGGVLLHFCWLTKNADRFVPSAHQKLSGPYSTEKQGSNVHQPSTADRKPACVQKHVSLWQ